MFLHDAIEVVLQRAGRKMTTDEIAEELNRNNFYKKKDGSCITAFQIHGRTRNYPRLFSRDGRSVSLVEQLKSPQNLNKGKRIRKSSKGNLLFLNTGWMNFYKGMTGDRIIGGGKHVRKEGWGGEMFNFKPFQNKLYGYVQPKIDRKYRTPSSIKLEKLGGSKIEEKINNITVVWTATHPENGGTRIIGWYKNATVYRYEQSLHSNLQRKYKDICLNFYVVAKEEDSTLLSVDERNVVIRRQEKAWMGQSNVWYADKNPDFVKLIKDYIFKGRLPKQPGFPGGNGDPRQLDPLKRIEVEKSAIKTVTKYYRALGYLVESFEKDNVGWDLTATIGKTRLKLEVKGLSGSKISTELTPNEYKNLKNDRKSYRLCIVTDALIEPKLIIFLYSNDNKQWTSEDGTILKFKEVISTQVYI